MRNQLQEVLLGVPVSAMICADGSPDMTRSMIAFLSWVHVLIFSTHMLNALKHFYDIFVGIERNNKCGMMK